MWTMKGMACLENQAYTIGLFGCVPCSSLYFSEPSFLLACWILCSHSSGCMHMSAAMLGKSSQHLMFALKSTQSPLAHVSAFRTSGTTSCMVSFIDKTIKHCQVPSKCPVLSSHCRNLLNCAYQLLTIICPRVFLFRVQNFCPQDLHQHLVLYLQISTTSHLLSICCCHLEHFLPGQLLHLSPKLCQQSKQSVSIHMLPSRTLFLC